MNFEYKISQSSSHFLDTEVYIKNNKLYKKTYRKEADMQYKHMKDGNEK